MCLLLNESHHTISMICCSGVLGHLAMTSFFQEEKQYYELQYGLSTMEGIVKLYVVVPCIWLRIHINYVNHDNAPVYHYIAH